MFCMKLTFRNYSFLIESSLSLVFGKCLGMEWLSQRSRCFTTPVLVNHSFLDMIVVRLVAERCTLNVLHKVHFEVLHDL